MQNETRNLIEDKFIELNADGTAARLTEKGNEEIKRFIRKNPGMFLLVQQFVREKEKDENK